MPIIVDWEAVLPRYLKILVYGPSDSGKTVLLSCASNLVPETPTIVNDNFFIDADSGMISQVTSGAGIIVANRWPNPSALEGTEFEGSSYVDSKDLFYEGLRYANQNSERFRYLTVDTLDRLQEMYIEELRGERERPRMQDWGDALMTFEDIGRTMPKLKMHVIMSAHSSEVQDETDGLMKKMPIFKGKFKDKISGYFDVVAYYERVLDTDSGEYVRRLHFSGTSDFFARSRLGGLFGDHIDNPTIPQIINDYEERRESIIVSMQENLG